MHQHKVQSKEAMRASLSILSSDDSTAEQAPSPTNNKPYIVALVAQFLVIAVLAFQLLFSTPDATVTDLSQGAFPSGASSSETDFLGLNEQRQAVSDTAQDPARLTDAQNKNAENQNAKNQNTKSYALTASGVLKAKRVSTVSSEITAKLEKLLVEEGDQVKAGEAIAVLDDELIRYDVAIAEHSLNVEKGRLVSQRTRLKFIEQDVQRTKVLFEQNSIGQREYNEMLTSLDELRTEIRVSESLIEVAQESLARKQIELEKTNILAPFDGVVASLNASEGEIVSPISSGGFTRTGIVTIVSAEQMLAEVWVPERAIAKIDIGQQADIFLDAWPDDIFSGEVTYISPVIDRQRAALVVNLDIAAASKKLAHEMNLEAKFKTLGAQ